jgi:hypothetical protein
MRSDEEWDLASKVVGACAGLLAVRIPRLWGKTILTVCVESEALRVDESIRAT